MKARRSFLLLTIAMLAVLACLVALGTWQVARLQWKTDLIESVNQRIEGAPVPLTEIVTLHEQTGDVNFYPVVAEGAFLSGEVHYLNTLNGASGWNIYAPFQLNDGQIVIVNRGFVPAQLKERELRPEPDFIGIQTQLTGLSRNALTEKPSSILPDNNIGKNEYYWRSLPDMLEYLPLDGQDVLPFFIDAGAEMTPEGGLPKAGTTRVSFSNNHLQYVITWYGLAVALIGVYIAMVRRRRGEKNDQD
jgi:surfeit locus 1 family protein